MTSFAELPSDLKHLLEQEKLEALAEFAAGAGHEMNNPLAVICGRAQLLLRTETDPERRRELAIIHTQALRVNEMIADLMLFARPPEPQRNSVDISQLCQKVLEEVRAETSGRQIVLVGQIEDGLLLDADNTQLSVALRALLDNALQAVGNAGTITLRCQQSEEEPTVQITIADSGSGIAPDVRRHLFDPYYSGRQAGRGLGLGLSKAWRILTNHGGRLQVLEPESGAAFQVVLPLREQAVPAS